MGEDLLGVLFGFDLFWEEDVLDDALLVDEVGGAEGADGLFATHSLFAQGAQGLEERRVGVGNEGEVERLFRDEFLMRGGAVLAHTEYLVAQLEEGILVVAQ